MPFWRYNLFDRQTLFSVLHTTPANLVHDTDEIHRRDTAHVMGYPSSLHLVARAILPSRRPTLRGKVTAVFTSSGSLLAFRHGAIYEAFGAPARDHYGTRECAVSMTECQNLNLHVHTEYRVVEVEAEEYGQGPIGVTGVSNNSTPVIRDQIGDVETRPENPSQRERSCDVFPDVDRRNEDYIPTPDSRFVGRLDRSLKEQVGILESQVLQDGARSLDVCVVPSPRHSEEDEKSLLGEIRLRLGSEIHVDTHPVTNIPMEHNGKFQSVKSRVGHIPT